MADNLSISIGIDTAKLRADAAIVKEELRKVNEQVKAAARAGDVGAVQAGAVQQDRLTRSLVAVNQQIRTNTAVTKESTQAHRAYTASLKETGLEFAHLAHAAGLPIEGIKALRAGFLAFAGVEVVRGLTAITGRITEISRLSKETGFDPSTVQQWEIAVKKAGGTSADAAASIGKLGAALQEAQGKASFERFLPVGVQGEQDPFKALNIDILRFKEGAAGAAQLLQRVAQELVRLNQSGKIAEANWRTVQILGKSYRELESAIQAAASGDLSKLHAAVTETDIAKVKAYNDAINALTEAWNGLMNELVRSELFQGVIHFVNDLTQGIHDSIQQIKDLIGWLQQADAYLQKTQPLGGTPSAAPDATAPAVSQAAGGYIRGPGSGTSDSILARLSNGEFVVNAASTRRLGTSFLNGLNSFAAGGLVNVPPIRFAAGGLVPGFAAGGNAMASFHFESGSSFKLGGPVDVVNAMVTEAHTQQMRSAGVKPSWFAGRPGGR